MKSTSFHFKKDGNTALHLAAHYGHTDLAMELMAAGANVDERDNDGATPLWYAAIRGYLVKTGI